MSKREIDFMPNTQQALKKMGANIKKARLRRNMRAALLAEQAGISKGTLSAIEKGVPTVSIGAYAAVLAVLGLDTDFQLVAEDEEGKKEFWEQNLQRRARATRKMNDGGSDDGREQNHCNHQREDRCVEGSIQEYLGTIRRIRPSNTNSSGGDIL